MTQDERWIAQWQEIIDFMAENQRRPSKFVDSERGMRNWWKHQQKLMNAGGSSPNVWRCFGSCWRWGRSIGT